MNDALIFESLFLIFLFANIALGFYLYLREAKSIREHRNKVPHVFSGLVSLDAHKAASDARLYADKVNEIRHLSNLVLVLLLTFGGGVTWFSTLLTNQLGSGLFTQILFALVVALAFLVINALFLAIAKNPEKNSSYLILRNFGSTRSKVSNLLAFLCALSMLPVSASFAKSPTIEDGVLLVGTDSSFAPFEFLAEDGLNFTGFDMDLIRAIGKELGYKVVVQNMGFDATVPALRTGIVDAVIAGMTINEKRKKFVDFSDPYYTSGLIIMVPSSDTTTKSIKDLEGKKIGAQVGTTGMFRAEKVPGAKVVTFANAAETFLEFQNGGVDAVIQDFPVVAYYVAQGGNKGRLVGPKMEAEEYGIAVTKGNKELVAQINKALASLKKSGEFQRIYKKWFGEEN